MRGKREECGKRKKKPKKKNEVRDRAHYIRPQGKMGCAGHYVKMFEIIVRSFIVEFVVNSRRSLHLGIKAFLACGGPNCSTPPRLRGVRPLESVVSLAIVGGIVTSDAAAVLTSGCDCDCG